MTSACIGIRAVLWASRRHARHRRRAVVTTEQRTAAAARWAQQPVAVVARTLQLARQDGAVSVGMVCEALGLDEGQAETLLEALAGQHLLVRAH